MVNSWSFARGYVVGSGGSVDEAIIPRGWTSLHLGHYKLWHDPHVACHKLSENAALVGHIYNPWSGDSFAATVSTLTNLLPHFRMPHFGDEALWRFLDEASGRFVLVNLDPAHPWAVSDAVSLRPLYYTFWAGTFMAASHSQLLANVAGMERDAAVDLLTQAKFYRMGVRHLPGLKTPFRSMRRLAANHWLDAKSGSQHRFFPREPHGPVQDWGSLVTECAEVLRTSAELLCTDHQLAVSLSMGTDSRCTLAACRGVRNRISFFSYASDEAEERDAAGAQDLCRRLRVSHETYPVDVKAYVDSRDYEFERLLARNCAGVRVPRLSEIAKIKTLAEQFPAGLLELKTHVSEIGRAFYCKKMAVNNLPQHLSARDMSNLYKKNLFDRRLLRWMDEAFAEFRDFTSFGQEFYDYEEHDMFYWEHRMPQWAALANQDHDVIHGMTSLFNNRRLLANFLKPERVARIGDSLHKDVIRVLWPKVLEVPLDSGSPLRARMRKTAERAFFLVNRF